MEVARTKLGIGLQKVESGHFKGFGQGGIAMCKPFLLDWRRPLKIS